MISKEQARRELQREKDGFWLGVKVTLCTLGIIGALIIANIYG